MQNSKVHFKIPARPTTVGRLGGQKLFLKPFTILPFDL